MYVKCDFPCLIFPMCLPSSVKCNQLPPAVIIKYTTMSHIQIE